jgi:hypothetical protein
MTILTRIVLTENIPVHMFLFKTFLFKTFLHGTFFESLENAPKAVQELAVV